MIARKITYKGNFSQADLGCIYEIVRRIEITGQVKSLGAQEIELLLEGDASMIKLVQHSVERKVKDAITDKAVVPMPFHYYIGMTLLT